MVPASSETTVGPDMLLDILPYTHSRAEEVRQESKQNDVSLSTSLAVRTRQIFDGLDQPLAVALGLAMGECELKVIGGENFTMAGRIGN